jgi:hypothetical protein
MDESKATCEVTSASELTAFQNLARALFGVHRKDVEKHEVKKRRPLDSSLADDDMGNVRRNNP